METRILADDHPGAIQEAAKALAKGLLIVFPTDTLYGVGADLQNPEALMRIYQAKVRPLEKGLPILVAKKDDLNQVVSQIPDDAVPLIEKFWPGPLTLILPKQSDLPAILSPNEGIAVRMPDNDIALKVISAAGGAVAVSSANMSGESPSCNAGQALKALGGLVSLIIDSGTVPIGRASTVVDCLGSPPRLLRQGPIPFDHITNSLAVRS